MMGECMKILLAVAAATLTVCGASAEAAVATATLNNFSQAGTIQNTSGLNLIGVEYNLSPESGSPPAPGTPIWDNTSAGSPAPTFSANGGLPNYFFIASWLGLNVASGNSFSFSGLDIDGYTGPGIEGSGFVPNFDGSEFIRLIFQGGATATAFFAPGGIGNNQTLVFEALDAAAVPVPGAIALFGPALFGAFAASRRKQRAA